MMTRRLESGEGEKSQSLIRGYTHVGASMHCQGASPWLDEGVLASMHGEDHWIAGNRSLE